MKRPELNDLRRRSSTDQPPPRSKEALAPMVLLLTCRPLVCLARGEAAVAVERAVAREARADEERRARIDVGDLANHAVADRDGHRQQRRRLVVERLQREAHVAVVELLRDVGADPAAVGRVEPGESALSPASNDTLSSSRELGAMPTACKRSA